jgi:hypothetical protein
MTKRLPALRGHKKMPPRMRALFGAAPVLSEDERSSYEEMLATLAAHIGPNDLIAWMAAVDIVSHTTELSLLRRFKIHALGRKIEGSGSAMADRWSGPLDQHPMRDSIIAWGNVGRKARGLPPIDYIEEDPKRARPKQVVEHQQRPPTEAECAASFEHNIDHYERIDRLAASIEARRLDAIVALERHLENGGWHCQEEAEDVIDADFSIDASGTDTAALSGPQDASDPPVDVSVVPNEVPIMPEDAPLTPGDDPAPTSGQPEQDG